MGICLDTGKHCSVLIGNKKYSFKKIGCAIGELVFIIKQKKLLGILFKSLHCFLLELIALAKIAFHCSMYFIYVIYFVYPICPTALFRYI